MSNDKASLTVANAGLTSDNQSLLKYLDKSKRELTKAELQRENLLKTQAKKDK